MKNLVSPIKTFLSKPFFSNPHVLLGLWIALAVISALMKINRCNNFLIFKYTFFHTCNGTSLFAHYPEEFHDCNHYGPVFSLVIAPFAVLPHPLGLLMWHVVLALCLYVAIRHLPMPQKQKIFIYWFCAHELLTALFMSQFNIATAAMVIATFICVQKEKDIWATFFILLGTFIKLYGIVGLAFFFFSRHKLKFVLSFFGWAAVMFVLPMLISSPEYIVGQYKEWYESLLDKNAANMFSKWQNHSLLGIVRKISGVATYSDLWLIVPGMVAFALPYLRIGQYKHLAFRYAVLASVLLFIVLFSTGSESSTYIIALAGVAIWYVTAPWQRSRWDVALMVFAFFLTSMSPSDLFPAYVRRTYVQPYALKALPCVLIWIKLVYEMMRNDYRERLPKAVDAESR